MLALSAALLFLVVLNNVQRRWQIGWVVVAWVAVGSGLAAWGIWQWASGDPMVWGAPAAATFAGRALGTFLRPSHYAAFLVLTFAIGGAFCFFSRWRYRPKVLLAVCCLLMAAGVLLTFAVAGWAGWLVAAFTLGAYAFRRRGFKFRWLAIGATLWMGLVIGALIVLQARRLAEAEPPWLPIWQAAGKIGRDNLVVGAGPGMFHWLYPAERTFQGEVTYVGNEYLNLLADYGVAGVLMALWFVVAFVYSALKIVDARARRYSQDTLSNRYALVVAGLAAFGATAVHSAFDFNLHVPAILFGLTVLTALAMTCGVHPSGHIHDDDAVAGRVQTVAVKGIARWLLVAALLVVLALHGSRLMKSGPAEWLLWRGQLAQTRLDWDGAQQRFERAWRFDPQSYRVAEALGDLYMARATWTPAQAPALFTEATRWYERAYTRNPYANDVLAKMSRALDATGNRQEAAERLERAVRADPHNASFQAQLGLHYERWGDTEKALECYRRSYELGGDTRLAAEALRSLELP
jgi:hypothetical protein